MLIEKELFDAEQGMKTKKEREPSQNFISWEILSKVKSWNTVSLEMQLTD
jgi:hypothetical protein